MRLHFWPVDYVLWIFKACYAYEKCSLESKECFGSNYRIIRHVEMISRQERVTFVDIQEMTLPKSQSLILDAPKKLFSKSREASFLARRLRSMDFQSMLYITWRHLGWKTQDKPQKWNSGVKKWFCFKPFYIIQNDVESALKWFWGPTTSILTIHDTQKHF